MQRSGCVELHQITSSEVTASMTKRIYSDGNRFRKEEKFPYQKTPLCCQEMTIGPGVGILLLACNLRRNHATSDMDLEIAGLGHCVFFSHTYFIQSHSNKSIFNLNFGAQVSPRHPTLNIPTGYQGPQCMLLQLIML